MKKYFQKSFRKKKKYETTMTQTDSAETMNRNDGKHSIQLCFYCEKSNQHYMGICYFFKNDDNDYQSNRKKQHENSHLQFYFSINHICYSSFVNGFMMQ